MFFYRIKSGLLKKKFKSVSNVWHLLSMNLSEGNVRVRFAPSPTGFLHLGGLRTAFYNYLFAKHNGGAFILRIEDTDQERVVESSIENLENMLIWAQLRPDEGPNCGGNHGPYIQSQRTELYREEANHLLKTGSAYRCFCSEMRINLLRKEALKNREIPKYDNRCRRLTQQEIDEKMASGTPFTIRLKLRSGPLTFNDMVYGSLTFDLSVAESDPIILKSDGFPTYHLANVVDDHHMGITHVLRGAEWQVSTPKHIMMYSAFGWEPPKYAHLPLILNKDGSKLSKRQNDIRIDYYKQNGYYSDAILNYLTNIGGGFGRHIEDKISELNALIQSFDINKVNVNNCKIETEKLKLYNRLCITSYSNNESINKVIEDLKSLLISKFGSEHDLNLDNQYLKSIISWSKDRIFTIQELINKEFLFLWKVPDFDWSIDKIGSKQDIEMVLRNIIEMLQKIERNDTTNSFNKEDIVKHIRSQFDSNISNVIKFNKFMKILRLSLTNLERGPPIAETMQLLGRQRTLNHLTNAYNYVNKNMS